MMRALKVAGLISALVLTGVWAVLGQTEKAPGSFWIAGLRSLGLLRADIPHFSGFTHLVRRESGNDALACPSGYCPRAEADIDSPVFEMDAASLAGLVKSVALAEPRTALISSAQQDQTRLKFQQATKYLRFPDIVDVEVMQLAPGRSTLAIWSRSVAGRKDFGVNLARVQRWLAELKRLNELPYSPGR